jgi:hypothetical protein
MQSDSSNIVDGDKSPNVLIPDGGVSFSPQGTGPLQVRTKRFPISTGHTGFLSISTSDIDCIRPQYIGLSATENVFDRQSQKPWNLHLRWIIHLGILPEYCGHNRNQGSLGYNDETGSGGHLNIDRNMKIL